MAFNNNRENEVYEYLVNFIEEEGYPPTVREICRDLGFSSTSTAQYYLKKLEDKNLISCGAAKNRAITIKNKQEKNFI
ncbi:MAG: repressor LexA, partial [Clostridia bacterium]|nr:repressor LexA [Clostridia bacterium]